MIHTRRCPPPFFHAGVCAAAVLGGRRPPPTAGRRQRLPGRAWQARPQEGHVPGHHVQEAHRTGHFITAQEAAIAFAQLKEDLELGMPLKQRRESQLLPPPAAAPKERRVGVYLGELLRLQQCVVPTVACALLSQQQTAAAVTRGVTVAYAEPNP